MPPGLVVVAALTAFALLGPPQPLPTVVVERHDPRAIETRIVGATHAQWRLLLKILQRVNHRHVEKIVISRATNAELWPPSTDGVNISLSGPETYEADWERRLVAGAFADASVDAGLAPVMYFGTDGYPGTAAGGGTQAVRRRPGRRSLRAVAEDVSAGAKLAGATVAEIRLLRPLGDALVVTLTVDDPAVFLTRRIVDFEGRFRDGRFSDGELLQVVGPRGEVIYVSSSTTRLETYGTWIPWRLQGCYDIAMPRPSNYEPPPCPLD